MFNCQDLDLRELEFFCVYTQLGKQLCWRGSPEDSGALLSTCHIRFLFSYWQNFRAVCSQVTLLEPQITGCQQDAKKKKFTFNVLSFHLLLKSCENLILHQAIPVASFFFTQLHVMFNDIIAHKRGIDRFHFTCNFFPIDQLHYLVIPAYHYLGHTFENNKFVFLYTGKFKMV